MPVRLTSIAALEAAKSSLGGVRGEVYQAIGCWDTLKDGPGPSIEDLADRLNRKESSICGRISELRKAGLIEEGPLKENSSGHAAMTYVAIGYAPPAKDPVQPDLFPMTTSSPVYF